MLSTSKKQKIIQKVKTHKGDTGSPEVQIALLSEEINRLVNHLRKHPKDNHSRRGLLGMVAKRKKLLNFLSRESSRRYNAIMKKVGLAK